jgi:DNA transformation protein and related proteins
MAATKSTAKAALKTASGKREFADYVVEQMAGFGAVEAKTMFGGFGIYRLGLMFALIMDDQLYFKVDAVSGDAFHARGLRPFTYEARGKASSLNYYEAPPEVFDEPAEMAEWAREAYACAVRKNKPKKPKTRTA